MVPAVTMKIICLVLTFVSRTDIIVSLASRTSSLFPLTLICGSVWRTGRKQMMSKGQEKEVIY